MARHRFAPLVGAAVAGFVVLGGGCSVAVPGTAVPGAPVVGRYTYTVDVPDVGGPWEVLIGYEDGAADGPPQSPGGPVDNRMLHVLSRTAADRTGAPLWSATVTLPPGRIPLVRAIVRPSGIPLHCTVTDADGHELTGASTPGAVQCAVDSHAI